MNNQLRSFMDKIIVKEVLELSSQYPEKRMAMACITLKMEVNINIPWTMLLESGKSFSRQELERKASTMLGFCGMDQLDITTFIEESRQLLYMENISDFNH